MRSLLDTVSMDGIVVIGEGEKDEAPMLYNGEHVGDGSGPEVDVAVDPLEGTTLAAKGMPNALCVVAISARGSMFDPGPCVYMEKLAGGPDLDGAALARRIRSRTCCRRVAKRRGVALGDLMVVVLDRPRHAEMITRIREAGARIRLISDGDVSGALLAVDAGHRHRPALGHRRHARGRALGRRHPLRRRHACWAGCGRATTARRSARATPATTSSAS